MVALRLCERKNWDHPISCGVVDAAYDLHEVVANVPGVIEVKVEMAEECLRIGIPYPVHTQVRFPYPVQAAGTAEVFVEVFPGPGVG
jgi:hypothetical protein